MSDGIIKKIQLPNGSIYDIQPENVYTKTEVDNLLLALPEPMIFKGSLGTGGTITTLPAAAATNEGFVYKVITDGTYASQSAKIGDTFISDGSAWVLIPSGDEPSGTVTSVGISNATNGGLSISNSPITSSGTISIGHSNILASAQTTSGIYPIKIDKNGHISEYGNAITIPSKTSDITNDSGFITSPNVVYCTCTTAKATAAKVATIVSGTLTELHAGDQAIVKFSNSNTSASPTLKIGNTDAKPIMRYGTTIPSASADTSWNAGSPVLFVYDGTNWVMVGWLNSVYSEISEANITNGTGSTAGLVTGRRAKKAVETFAPVTSVNGQTGAVTISTDNIFYADYAATSYADIMSAIDAGKEVILRDATTLASINLVGYYRLHWRYTREANYKQIVFTDGMNYVSVENDGNEDTWTSNQLEYHSLIFTNGIHNIFLEAPNTIANTNQTIVLPDKSGTIALTNDIPTVPTKTSDLNNDSGFLDKSDILDTFYPIGSYYETSDSSFDPNISWGGLWILELEGQTHVSGSINGEYTVRVGWNESNGGESRVKLTSYESGQKALTISSSGGHKHTVTAHYNSDKVASGSARAQWSGGGSSSSTSMAEIASDTGKHTHTISGSEAETSHENMPPYIVVYRWHRVDPDLIGYATLVLLDTTQITLMYSLEIDTDDQEMWWANWCQSGFNNIGAMMDSNHKVILPNGNYITPDGSSLLNFDTPIGTYQTYYETQV